MAVSPALLVAGVAGPAGVVVVERRGLVGVVRDEDLAEDEEPWVLMLRALETLKAENLAQRRFMAHLLTRLITKNVLSFTEVTEMYQLAIGISGKLYPWSEERNPIEEKAIEELRASLQALVSVQKEYGMDEPRIIGGSS